MGDIIDGRFEIETIIGQGAMGTVYRGLDLLTRQPVAIKLLKPDLVAGNQEMLERFIREAETLRKLNHPNIVHMIAAVDEGDRHYIVMEYIGGGTLADRLQKIKHGTAEPLQVEHVLKLALELTDALTRAHHLKVVHRDIKPSNILLEPDGTACLTDFGIARLVDESRLTESGLVVGTIAYLSPEACEGYQLDVRTDFWSFGVVLYEMLAGQMPFPGESTAATITAILTHKLPDLREIRPDIPVTFIGLIEWMLEKDLDQRIGNIRLVGATLESIVRGENLVIPAQRTPTVMIRPPENISEDTQLLTPSIKVRRRISWQRWLSVAGCILVIFVIGLVSTRRD